MEQYRVTGRYCTLESTGTLTGKQQIETDLTGSHKGLTKSVKSTGLCFIFRKSASFAFLSWLCRGLLRAPFFSALSPPFLARTVTLSRSPRLCYSARLISRSLIGWLPAPREIPFSLPPTHPATHPPLVRKCERV